MYSTACNPCANRRCQRGIGSSAGGAWMKAHVGDDHVGCRMCQGSERRFAAGHEFHRPFGPHAVHAAAQAIEDILFIVDEKDPEYGWNLTHPRHRQRWDPSEANG